MSGPPPDPNALRRNRLSDQAGWTMLPAEGRAGEPPAWPLVDVHPREWDLWRELWTRPQAVAWEQFGLELEVALFVRKLTDAERPGSSVELQKVMRQFLDGLGLSVQGMRRNRWRIAPQESEQDQAAEQSPRPPARRSARDRLKVVAHGDGS
ncbi:hypothetical protein [Actinopolyspora alba]|uniref:phage terminase small subunit n=1 Tax=Actinopolyspora alba TaxID=673379 RepID=UPI001C31E948|nr:hypothetical protein [Actinopolyspora alba]